MIFLPIQPRDEAHRFFGVGRFQLAAADGGGAAHLGLPDAGRGMAGLVQEHDVDVVLGRQVHDVAGQVHAGGDHEALDLVREISTGARRTAI